MNAQEFSVKRAEVEFHNFASLGEPERAMATYREENIRRAAILRQHLAFVGEMSPFLEIGANVGHTSYLLANDFGAHGFASDISADALRYGKDLQEHWAMPHAPVRVAADALHLPFRNNSLRFVMACQMLSQFMDIESVFIEVKRVLAPGGVFFFSEEPLLRRLSLRLYRCPYYDTMKPWERTLYDNGLLGYFVRDVIGAHQEESFGIRQNHTMGFADWDRLVRKHFVASEYELFVPERGWGETLVKRPLPLRIAAKLLGGTLSGFCRKEGAASPLPALDRFEAALQCPDCGGPLALQRDEMLHCGHCGYQAANEGGVYNLLRSADRNELYPGDRADIVDFSVPGHESKLDDGFYDVEGVYGNKYRWIGAAATAHVEVVNQGPQRLRIRGYAPEQFFQQGQPAHLTLRANAQQVGHFPLERSGLFVIEADLPAANRYELEIFAGPTWQMPPDVRTFTVNLSMIRLVPRE